MVSRLFPPIFERIDRVKPTDFEAGKPGSHRREMAAQGGESRAHQCGRDQEDQETDRSSPARTDLKILLTDELVEARTGLAMAQKEWEEARGKLNLLLAVNGTATS